MHGGPSRVITDLAVLDFEPESRRMRVIALQPGVALADVQAATGFDLLTADQVTRIPEPTPEELDLLRHLLAQPVSVASAP